ncbi:MAG: Hsp70 family protein [Spirochaetaceae bacterium]
MAVTIGIDLGTTNSVASFLDAGEAKIIPNERGNHLTPSIVSLADSGDILVGESAKNQAVMYADRTVRHIKRRMGGKELINLGERGYSPEEISSFILRHMKRQCERYLGIDVNDAVISVPAHFSEAQRRATMEAGQLAGLRVRRLINEPTAAALAFAREQHSDGRYLVYDLGGGTFDITCLEKSGTTFTVKASRGDNHLGGADFDALLLDRVRQEFAEQAGFDVAADPVLLQQLTDHIEQAKIELSSRESAMIGLPFAAASKPVHLRYTICREEFNELIGPLLQRTVDLTMRCVKDAGFGLDGIDGLVLSGGSSRIPLVRTYLHRALGIDAAGKVNPDEIVAVGAAVQAGIVDDNRDTISLNDVTSYSLGVEIEEDTYVRVLPRNSQIPATARRLFTTVTDNQSSVEIRVLQGDEDRASGNRSLGRFLLSGIREGRRGEPRIEVAFTVDADGIAHVTARDVDTSAEQRITVTPEPEEGVSAETMALRLSSLINRVSALAAHSRDAVDRDFAGEVDELLEFARGAVDTRDLRQLREAQIALEAVLHELNAASEEGAYRHGGA